MSDDNNTLSIITFYEKNRCLWDPAIRDYYNKIIKNKLLQELSMDVAIPSKYHVILNLIVTINLKNLKNLKIKLNNCITNLIKTILI